MHRLQASPEVLFSAFTPPAPLRRYIFLNCHSHLLASATLAIHSSLPSSSESHFPNSLLLPILPFFCRGLSCVLSSNPFKMPCTFLHEGNSWQGQGDERAGSHIWRGCTICCVNRRVRLGLASFRDECTFVMFLREAERAEACEHLACPLCLSITLAWGGRMIKGEKGWSLEGEAQIKEIYA